MSITSAVSVLAVATALAVPASAGAAQIGFSGEGSQRTLEITADPTDDRYTINIAFRAAAVDVEEVVTIAARFPTIAVRGCSVTAGDATVVRTVTCVAPVSDPVVVNMGDGRDTVTVRGTVEPVFQQDLPAGRVALAVAGGGQDDTITLLLEAQRADGAPAPVTADGGAGNDAVDVVRAPSQLRGGPGVDRLTGGTAGDALFGDDGSDKLLGGDGDDLLDGGSGGDVLDGGAGFDTVTYAGGVRTGGVEVSLDDLCNDGSELDVRPVPQLVVAIPGPPPDGCSANGVDRDNVLDGEVVVGTRFGDVLVGGVLADELFGADGDDVVEGSSGADVLHGGTGADTVLGRDELADRQIVCEGTLAVTGAQPNPGDRAVLDQFDPANPDCTSIERGGQGVTGPADPSPAPQPPPAGTAATPTPPPPAPPVGLFNGGSELGTLPGGGIAGRPPQARLLARRGTPDARGRLPLRLACVYQAKACAAVIELRAAKGLKAGSGRRAVRIAKGTVLGRAKLTVPWGGSARVFVPLTGRFRTLLARGRRPVSTRLSAVVRDSGQGAQAETATLVTTVTVGRRGR